jgi:hypothetical protein
LLSENGAPNSVSESSASKLDRSELVCLSIHPVDDLYDSKKHAALVIDTETKLCSPGDHVERPAEIAIVLSVGPGRSRHHSARSAGDALCTGHCQIEQLAGVAR